MKFISRSSKLIVVAVAIMMITGIICAFALTSSAANTYKVLLIEDRLPWDSNSHRVILSEISQYDVVSTSSVSGVNLQNYDMIVFSNDQYDSSYSNYANFKSKLEDYARSGGVILFGACSEGWGNGTLNAALPGNVSIVYDAVRYNYIADAVHPIVTGILTDNVALTNSDLYNEACSHTYFVENTLPAGSKVILRESDGDHPTLAEYPLGNGYVVASCLTWEHGYDKAGGVAKYFSRIAMKDMYLYALSLIDSYNCDTMGHSFTSYTYNNDATCTEDGTKTALCDNGCGTSDTVTVAGTKLGHSFTSYTYNNDATCTADGTETAFCDNGCGTSDTQIKVGTQTEHRFESYIFNRDATCFKNATRTASCKYGCGTKDTKEVPNTKLEHSFSEYEYNNDATCTEDGTQTSYCTRNCGTAETVVKQGSALGHDYQLEVKDATCTEIGGRIYTCSRCNDSYAGDPISAKGHKFRNYVSDNNATCTADGTKTAKCNRCDATDTVTDEGSALGHSFTSYINDGNATCTADGTKTASCDRCSVTDTVAAPGTARGHKFKNYQSDNNATCTDDGTETAICSRGCGATDTVVKAGSALGHNYIHEVIEPTCMSTGANIYTCSRCNHSYTGEVIPAADHALDTLLGVVEPDCTTQGYSIYRCSYCSETFTADHTAALGHTLVDAIIRPTCTEEGYTVKSCGYCDYSVKENIIPALGHSYETVVTEPTCTQEGSSTHTCTVCNESHTDSFTAANGHSYGEWQMVIEPTYFDEGEERRICSECEDIQVKTVAVKEYVNPFTDVKQGAWYFDAVAFAVKKGYMKGMSETIFSPNSNITREQFVLILANMAGVDTDEYKYIESGFTDVKTGQWFSGAVTWAVREGYVSGISADKFGRGQSIQRAALARMLYNYASKNGINVSGRADLSAFGDAAEFEKSGNAWMKEPVEWAVNIGIISGMNIEGKLCVNPKGTATRAQAARMLMVFDSISQ